MTKTDYSLTIEIDAESSTFHFYSMLGEDESSLKHAVKGYGGELFDETFFIKFKEAIKGYIMENPADGIRKTTVILPDSAVLTDTVKVPSMKGFGQTQKALDATLGGLFKNYSDLRITSNVIAQNKQYITYFIVAVKKNIVSSICAACSENKLLADTITFASNAVICGATVLDNKLKNKSYLFLDIKDTYSKFIFVVNGKTVGRYLLPFGLEFLKKDVVVSEDMLFNHSYAEISVINAKEKAKSKRQSVLAISSILESETDDETEDIDAEADLQIMNANIQPGEKIFRKKIRKLPKFMQREIPETKEGILYENFRIFVKWALTLIRDNEKLTELGELEFVCVNIPNEFSYVLDKVNEKVEENKIEFTAFKRENIDDIVISNLELYGGLFSKLIGKMGEI